MTANGEKGDMMPARIMSVRDLLSLPLRIPSYQRPYRWSAKNVSDLIGDINQAVTDAKDNPGYKYRIGSVILHNNVGDGCYDIVDGQQRLLTLTLLAYCLNEGEHFPLLDKSSFSNCETMRNLRANYDFLNDWVGYQSAEWSADVQVAFKKTLEAVVIEVDTIEEAFQLFDSQNTRGRALDPHDLLKAYHLRAMRNDVYEMRHVVTRWEEFSTDDVRKLFASYLFPILNWELKEKARPFTAKEIDAYKGIEADRGYAYAARARRAAPCFQIGEPFIEGEDFFLMAEHYLQMQKDVEHEIENNGKFGLIRDALRKDGPSAGYRYACDLFRCALFAYYDRFHNFDERAVRKLFVWALMIRVDMHTLGFGTINKYATGKAALSGQYTNVIPMFACIARARHHTDIADIKVEVGKLPERANDERSRLHNVLTECSKGGAR